MTRTLSTKLAAIACHPSTSENEWQAAAVAFFRHHRRHGTSPAEPPKADPFKYWHFGAPAPRGPIWMPTEADGNTKYPGLNIAEIVLRDPAYAIRLVEANNRRDATNRKGEK